MLFRQICTVAAILLFASAISLSSLATEPSQSGSNAKSDNPVSIESLLNDMIDRDSIAIYPAQNFRLKQASSYNRESKTPDEPKGWFANKDFNNHFIRIDEKNGQQEWVLMDHTGPGAIVRTWMPWHNQLESGSPITMRIYLDGEEQPTLEGNMLSMFDGSGFVPFPLAHTSLRSAVNFFPIPYQKGCKVTLDAQPFFYQFTYREYDAGTAIETFSMKDFEAAKTLTQKTGETLLNPDAGQGLKTLDTSGSLKETETVALDLPTGTAAVRELSVKLDNYSDPNITRHVVLKIEFDGKETVWCPDRRFLSVQELA